MSTTHIAICTPAYGGQLTTGYTNSLISTILLLNSKGIRTSPLFLNNESLVQRGRNTLVAQAMADPSVTHILFIDADISWNAPNILRLIEKDTDIVGGIYPHKHYAWERLAIPEEFQKIQRELSAWKKLEELQGRAVTPQTFINKFRSFLLKFNIVFPRNVTKARIENGFVQVERIATGMMLIKRSVFEKMMEAHPDWHYTPNTLPSKEEIERVKKFNYAFFDCKIDEHGQYLSEDWYFCSEWRKLGGNVWADLSMPLAHGGFHVFMGMVSDTLMSFSSRLESILSQQTQQTQQNTMLDSQTLIPEEEEEDEIEKLVREAEEMSKQRQQQTNSTRIIQEPKRIVEETVQEDNDESEEEEEEDDLVKRLTEQLAALRKQEEEKKHKQKHKKHKGKGKKTQKETDEELVRRLLHQSKRRN